MQNALQLNLFPEVIESAQLVVQNSPRGTFYRIWIEQNVGIYSVCKESGTKGKVLDRRCWPVENFDQAEMLFKKIVKEKTDLNRKSPRKYRLA